MAKLTKPNYTNVWASAAGGGSVEPNPLKIQTGWVVERPDFEYMNWVQNRQDSSIAYSFQMGVPEWDSTVEYQYSSTNWASFVQYKGIVYKAIQTGTNKNPETQTAYWAKAFDDEGDAQDVQDNLDDHIVDYGTLENLTNAATARTNLDVYSKAEAAEKNGDNTEVFEAANGTTGKEVVNYSQFITKADKNGNSGEVFNVADATTATHAVSKQQFDAKTAIATTTIAGIVEKATQGELNAGTADVWPDAATIYNGLAKSLGASGYIKLPVWMGGLVVQWGVGTAASTDTIVFPTAFSNNVWIVVGSDAGNASSGFGTAARTLSSFVLATDATPTLNYNYIAIGN